jgi:glycosyltransferase involved in cell wall biosynthesis
MRLLIDSVFAGSGGALQLRNELAPAIAGNAEEGSDVVLLAATSDDLPSGAKLTVSTYTRPPGGWLGRWWWYNRALPRIARDYRADTVYFLSGIVPRSAARLFPSVTNFNNMIPFSPEQMGRYPLLSRARARNVMLRRLYVSGVRRADAVVLHSQHAVDMVIRYAGDISHKTYVVHTGVPRDIDPEAAARSAHPYCGKPYFLYLSTFHPYKNQLALVAAYARALDTDPRLPDLALAGIPTDRRYFEHVLESIRAHDLGGRVKYLGVLSRSEMPNWIHHAEVNFFASTCETNPVTLAEILALRGVLACSTTAPMPEIVRDAAEFFDPYSIDSIARTMLALSRDPERRAQLRQLGVRRAAELSWNECAAQIWRAARDARAAYWRRNGRTAEARVEARG